MPYDTLPNVVEEADEDEADHCTCDLGLTEDETTTDAELPPAVGGVQALEDDARDDEDEHIDCCEIGCLDGEATADEELPVTVGGM
jgi:hypothetical protein